MQQPLDFSHFWGNRSEPNESVAVPTVTMLIVQSPQSHEITQNEAELDTLFCTT